ncbi:hypothetical protein TSOC_003590, partial [Tetrabaena socialis]
MARLGSMLAVAVLALSSLALGADAAQPPPHRRPPHRRPPVRRPPPKAYPSPEQELVVISVNVTGEVSVQTAHHDAQPDADEFDVMPAPQLTYRLVDRENATSTVNTKVDFGDDVGDLITGDVLEASLSLKIPKDVADKLGL